MDTSLIKTKLFVPRTRPKLVSRQRLLDTFKAGLQLKLTLVAAPAGYGKTTLISEGIRSSHIPAGWLTLDENDNNTTRFWSYIISALQTIKVDIGQSSLEMLQSPQPPPIESLLTNIVNEMSEVDEEFALVIDDYHVIENQPIHDSLTFWINNLPLQSHLVIGSRTDPPFPLARWRARGQSIEVRAKELRFTPNEVAAFLNQVMDLGLSDEEIAALENRTEGWIAGLQMAGLSMYGRDDISDFITDFSGSNRFVLEYLIKEVLQQQEEDVRSFLYETCILDRLTALLCDTVTGRSDGREMLSRLEAANLFVEPLDDYRQWYRYHPLFADLLRNELRTSQPDLSPILHRRASDWYNQQGSIQYGIKHALDAQDYAHVVQMIEQHATEIFQSSELNTLVGWIQALPRNMVEERPKLSMIFGWALLATGNAEEAEMCMRNIEHVVGTTADVLMANDIEVQLIPPDVLGALVEVTALRGNLAIRRFDIPLTLNLMQQVLPYVGDDNRPYLYNPPSALRPVVIFNMAIAYDLSGQVKDAIRAFTQAVELGSEQHNHFIVMYSMSHLVELQLLRGQLGEAEKICHLALKRGTDIFGPSSPIIGFGHVSLGNLLYERNELEMALKHLQEGISLLKPWRDLYGLLFGYTTLAQIKSVEGEWQDAFEDVNELIELCSPPEAQMLLLRVKAFRASLWIKQGDLDAAQQWADMSGLNVDGDLVYFREGETLILAQLLIEQKKTNDAIRLLSHLLVTAQNGEREGRIIEILILQAIALKAWGKHDAAITTFQKALVLGQPEGYVRTFLDKGEPVLVLLRELNRQGIVSQYTTKLLAAFEMESARQKRSVAAPALANFESLVEPISWRELQILRLMADGLSNQQIGDTLYISKNTVKWHARHIFEKLGVNRRAHAINRARDLNIL